MKIKECKFEEVKSLYKMYYQELNGGFDDYYDTEIVKSKMFVITDNVDIMGAFSVKENTLTSLYVLPEYKYRYKEIFNKIRVFDYIHSITMSSNDTYLMNEVLLLKSSIKYFAVNYKYTQEQPTNITMVHAKPSDIDLIKSTFGDFLDNYEEYISNENLYLYFQGNDIVSMVNIHKMIIPENAYSLGIVVNESYRSRGIGVQSFNCIANKMLALGANVHSGHWIYNHRSSRLHEKTRFTRTNILMKVEEI